MRVKFALGAISLVIALAAGLATVAGGGAATFYQAGATGYDVSYPQCSSQLPRNGDFGIVGVTNGLPWSINPCLRSQFQWASSLDLAPAFYVNTANPGPPSPYWNRPGPKTCAAPTSYQDTGCSYNYGWNAAAEAYRVVSTTISPQAAAAHYWWLDVETMNSWEGHVAANAATMQGYYDYFVSRGVPGVGIYSTSSQWNWITGGYQIPGAPSWVATVTTERNAPRYCGSGFTGGAVLLVQYRAKGFDGDYVCGSSVAVRR